MSNTEMSAEGVSQSTAEDSVALSSPIDEIAHLKRRIEQSDARNSHLEATVVEQQQHILKLQLKLELTSKELTKTSATVAEQNQNILQLQLKFEQNSREFRRQFDLITQRLETVLGNTPNLSRKSEEKSSAFLSIPVPLGRRRSSSATGPAITQQQPSAAAAAAAFDAAAASEAVEYYDLGLPDTNANIVYSAVPKLAETRSLAGRKAGDAGRMTLTAKGAKALSTCTVEAIVLGAKELRPPAGVETTIDPYVTLHVVRRSQPRPEDVLGTKPRAQTKVVPGAASPTWNATLQLVVNMDKELEILAASKGIMKPEDRDYGQLALQLSVVDWGQGEHRLIGHVIVPIEGIAESGTPEWHDLKDGGGKLQLALSVVPMRADVAQPTMKAATLTKLVERLTPPDRFDRDLDTLLDLLLAYRQANTPRELLDALVRRYAELPGSDRFEDSARYETTVAGIRDSVANVLLIWIERTDDFSVDTSLCDTFKAFYEQLPDPKPADLRRCYDRLSDSSTKVAKELVDSGAASLGPLLDRVIQSAGPDGNRNTSDVAGSGKPVRDIDPSTLAEQFTLLEYVLLRRIRLSEFHKQAWNKTGKETNAPNILSYISWFNHVSHWVSTEIVNGNTAEQRAVIIANFITMAMRLKKLNNFNGIMEVISSLHSAAISRLKKTWALIPSELINDLETLTDLLGPSENFKKYRDACRAVGGTFLPYLGLWLTDFTFIDDANVDLLDGGLINWDKAVMLAKRLREFDEALLVPYTKPPHSLVLQEPVINAIVNAEVWEENEIFKMSRLREERMDDDSQLPSRFDSKQFAKISKSILNGVSGKAEMDQRSKLTQRDWQLLMACAQVKVFSKDEIIISEGAQNDAVYRIKTGSVRIEKLMEDGSSGVSTPQKIATKGPPDTFGEMSVLGSYGIASATVIADEQNTELYCMEMDFVNKLFETEPGLCLRFHTKVAKDLARIFNHTLERLTSRGEIPLDQAKEDTTAAQMAISTRDLLRAADIGAAIARSKESSTDVFEKIAKLFELQPSEVIIKSYRASLKKKIYFSGTLYITQNFVCFYSTTFGYKTKEKMPISQVLDTKQEGDHLTIVLKTDVRQRFQLKSVRDCIEANELILQLASRVVGGPRQRASMTLSGGSPGPSTPRGESSSPGGGRDRSGSDALHPPPTAGGGASLLAPELEANTDQVLPRQDWELIVQGSKAVSLPRGTIIIQAGQSAQHRLYQISSGSCRVEANGQVIRRHKEGEVFGQELFVPGNVPSASVIADSAELHLTIIEGYFVTALFNVNVGFASRFYKYIGVQMAQRIRDIQRMSAQGMLGLPEGK